MSEEQSGGSRAVRMLGYILIALGIVIAVQTVKTEWYIAAAIMGLAGLVLAFRGRGNRPSSRR